MHSEETDSRLKVNEPEAMYYSQPMMQAMRQHIIKLVEKEQDVHVLEKVSELVSPMEEKSFESRYLEAREFVRMHFSEEFFKEMEKRNFMIDEPYPYDKPLLTEEDYRLMHEEAVASGYLNEEEAEKRFAVWDD